jgi:hypothetical protein
MDDQLNGRKIVPEFGPPQRGPFQEIDVARIAGVLSAALADCPAVHLFNDAGRVVLLARGALHPVNAEILHELIQANCVSKTLRIAETTEAPVWEREYRPVDANSMVVRTMLTSEKHGLIGRLPAAVVQQVVAAVEQEQPPVVLPADHRPAGGSAVCPGCRKHAAGDRSGPCAVGGTRRRQCGKQGAMTQSPDS